MKLLSGIYDRPNISVPGVLVAGSGLLCVLLTATGCDRSSPTQNSEKSVVEAKPEETKETSPVETKNTPAKTEEVDLNKPSAKAAAKIISALPDEAFVQSVVNPQKLAPYSGATGSVRGVVFATGDPPPPHPEVLAKMDATCTTSRTMYGSLFREGPQHELADVLVAVTEYKGFVPAKSPGVKVLAQGCAWPARTIAMTFGQNLMIDGADNRPYVPELLGQPMPAQLFVLPTAPPVELPPKKPGRFKLVDSMRLFSVAEVFVLPYATAAVTDEVGRFEITGIPVGKVKVNALLPQTGAVAAQEVTIEADKVTELKFELSFDRAAYDKKEKPTPLDELPAPE
jgi:hypothetical protein